MYYFSILYSFPPFIFQGGQFGKMFRSLKLKMTTSGPVPDNKLNLVKRNAPRNLGLGRPPGRDDRQSTAGRGAPRFELHATPKHGPVCPRFAAAWPGRARPT